MSQPDTKTILEVHDLQVDYDGVRALQGVSLRVERGSITALVGANGAGKTTLLRAISGIVRPRAGAIRFEGDQTTFAPPHSIVRRGIAHVPEGRGTFGRLTTDENLRVGGLVRRDHVEVRRDLERVYALLPKLAERRTQLAGTLSGGEQQMLAIGRALMGRPKVLLLDEPSFGLAPRVVQDVYRIVREALRAERVGALLVEQNASMALDLAGAVCLLETGRVVHSGPADAFRGDATLRRVYLGG